MNGLPELPYEIPPGAIDFHRENAHRLRSECFARWLRALIGTTGRLRFANTPAPCGPYAASAS